MRSSLQCDACAARPPPGGLSENSSLPAPAPPIRGAGGCSSTLPPPHTHTHTLTHPGLPFFSSFPSMQMLDSFFAMLFSFGHSSSPPQHKPGLPSFPKVLTTKLLPTPLYDSISLEAPALAVACGFLGLCLIVWRNPLPSQVLEGRQKSLVGGPHTYTLGLYPVISTQSPAGT